MAVVLRAATGDDDDDDVGRGALPFARSAAFLERCVANRCSVAALSAGPVSQEGSGEERMALVGVAGSWRGLEANLDIWC
jgi:hypothetical protein